MKRHIKIYEDFINEDEDNYVSINNILYLVRVYADDNGAPVAQFMPNSAKDLDKVQANENRAAAEVQRYLINQTPIKWEHNKQLPGAGLNFTALDLFEDLRQIIIGA
jgi:hypothetical protein